MGAGDEKHALVSKAVRPHTKRRRARICHRHCSLDVKFSLTAMVEQAEGCLTALLDLGDYQPRADCVNRPGGDENDIVWEYGLPHDKIRNGAVVHCPAQLLSGEPATEAECYPGTGRRTKDVPRLRFTIRQSHRARIRIVGMDLDGKGFAREKQLEQKRRTQGGFTRSIVPDFADRAPVLPVLFQGRRSTTPQGFGRACVSASSIVILLRQRENFAKPGRVSGKRVASVASETTQMISIIDQVVLQLRTAV